MDKGAQSILDFINFLPLQVPHARKSTISGKEAKTLYEVFQSDRDESGKIIVPDSIDSLQIAALSTKGLVRQGFTGNKRTVEFTTKGKEIVRNIVLSLEKSSFEKSHGDLDYESIFRRAKGSTNVKIASIQKAETSWLKRVQPWK